MSKISKYLNEHILGEAVTDETILRRLSVDGSILRIKPEFAVYPRLTSDIRKVARFAWQLAEKGHVLPLTPRGDGSNETGAAIGSGAIVSLAPHMNRVFEYDEKQKLVRLQPGASVSALQNALMLSGASIPALPNDSNIGTVGGAIASDSAAGTREIHGTMRDWVYQLEVVLANGDVLQTGRLSKRELNKKKGIQGLEGEIYRQLDGLIEDNKQLIDEKLGDIHDATGYGAIAQVKRKDGSFDLAPLFSGSQGTLGIISEMILKADYVNDTPAVAGLTFADSDKARDAVDQLKKLKPSAMDYFDAAFFDAAAEHGKKYSFFEDAKTGSAVGAVLMVQCADFSVRSQKRFLKKVSKIASQLEASIVTSDEEEARSYDYVKDVTKFWTMPASAGTSAPAIIDGVFVPFERFESFSKAVQSLAKKYHVALPLHAQPLDNIVNTRPRLQLQKVGDKQKVFKLMSDYAALVEAHGGYFISTGSEGRLKSVVAFKQLDGDVAELFQKIKAIFDPHGILNPEVKQPADVRKLASQLRSDADLSIYANSSLPS